MKKRILSLFLAFTLCLTLQPTSAFAKDADGCVSSETTTVESDRSTATGVPNEGGEQSGYDATGEKSGSETDARTEIWCISKPDSIGRSYDGTTYGSTVPINLTFTDGTNETELKEGTDFTAVKTFDSADAGWHTVTVEITLIGEAAAKYKLKEGEEKFTIGGTINKAYPDLTVSLSKTTCAVGENLLPLLSVEGAPEDAEVTYYYLAAEYKRWAGSSDVEGSEVMPKIDENTAISETGTYYVYAKTGKTKNYEEKRSTIAEFTVGENTAAVASVTTTDGTETTYSSFNDAWAAAIASEGSTLKLLDNVDIGDADDGLSVDSGKFTLDLNGKTLSGSAYLQLIDVSGTADITIQNGKLVNTFNKDQSDIFLGNANAVNIAGGKVVLENVEVTSGCGEDGAQTGAVYVYDGSLTVTSGTFTGAIVVAPQSPDVHPALKITSATLHNGIGYLALGSSVFDYDGVRALFASGSMLFDKDGKYIDIAKGEYWVSVGAGEDAVTEFAYSEESIVKSHTHTIVNGKCECGYTCNHKNADGSSTIGADSKCTVCGTEVCEQGCIAHAVWSPYIGYPDWETTHIKTLDELQEKITSPGTKWIDPNGSENATVTFLSDVTVEKTFIINNYFTHIILDLNGHTLSGNLDSPLITAEFGSLASASVDFKNGRIVNTGTGDAIYLAKGRVTLEGLDVIGRVGIKYGYPYYADENCTSSNYHPTFLAGSHFSEIYLDDAPENSFILFRYMMPVGGYFAGASGKRVEGDELYVSTPLKDVTVKPCGHEDAGGNSTFTDKRSNGYYYCSVCGMLCPHANRTENADGTLHCDDCNLTLTAVRSEHKGKGTTTYYINMSDAFGNDKQPVIRILCDQTCTQSALTYFGSNTIDLNGFMVTAQSSSGKLFDPYIFGYELIFQNSAANQGHYICEYLRVEDGKLTIPAENNNLTISAVVIEGSGTASLAGGNFGSIEIGEGSSKKLTDLLASEYYFTDTTSGEPVAMYDADGNALIKLTHVTVMKCSHDEVVYVPADGGAWKCFCGKKTFTASVTKDGTTTYFEDLKKAFDSADGGTVKLLASMVDVTVDTGKPFIFDLNGCDVYSLTVNNKITLRDSGEKKGKITEWLRVPAGMTVGDLLEEGYAFKCSDGTWPSESSNAVSGVGIQQAPITSVGLIALNADRTDASTTMAYGMTKGIRLSASCNLLNLTQTDCKWYKLGGTASPIEDATGMNYFLPEDLSAGTHTYRVTFTSDGYSKSADITITVTPISIEGAAVTVKNPIYNGAAQTPAVTVKLGNKTLIENKDYIVTVMEQTNAGSYQLSVRGKGGYEGEIDNEEWKIEPIQLLGYCDVQSLTKTYDGTVAAPLTKSNLTFHAKNGAAVTLPEDAYDITSARFTMRQDDGTYIDSPDAGNGKSLSYTLILKSGNYVFKDDPENRTIVCNGTTDDVNKFTITQDTISLSNIQFTQVVFNNLAKSYEIELKTHLDNILSQQHRGCEYGEITYGLPRIKMATEYYDIANGAKIKNGKLILPIKTASSKNGEIGNVTIEVETTNYQTFDLVLQVIAQDKIVPVLATDSTIRATDITYGQTLNESMIKITGKMICPRTGNEITGTFTWTNPETRFDAVGSFDASWTFTPDASFDEYAAATGIVTVTVNKAMQYGKISMAGYTYGETPTTPTLAERTGDMNASVTYYYADGNTVKEWNISAPPALKPGTYRMYAQIGETDNYYGYYTAYCDFVVAKATPAYTKPTGLHATYGQTLADVKLPDGWTWMNSIESVGNATAGAKSFRAKFTPENTDNYNTVENIELEVTVNKADGNNLKTTEVMRRYTDTADHTYTPDWSGLPDGQIWRYSSEYSVSDGSTATLTKQDIAAVDGKLTYAISGGKDGDVVTITIKASCGNYEDFTIVLNINLVTKGNQEPLVITGNTTMVYGEKLTLTTDGGSGTGAVTYSIDNAASTGAATIDPNTGVLIPVRVGSVHVIATKAGDNDYNEVTSASFVLIIKPATPIGEPKYTEITTGDKTLKDAALTIEGSTLKPNAGKLEWVDDKGSVLPDDTRVEANTTYKWRFTPEDGNYTSLTGEIELYHVSAGDDYSYNTIVDAPQTGDSGQMHTITGDPHTGDSSRILLWITLLLVSGFGVIGAAIYGKRKNIRNNQEKKN